MTTHSSIKQPKPIFIIDDSSPAWRNYSRRGCSFAFPSCTSSTMGEDFPVTVVTIDGLFNSTRDDTRRNARPSLPGESASEHGKKMARNPNSRRYFREGRHMPCSDLAPHRHTFLLQQFFIIFVIDIFFNML